MDLHKKRIQWAIDKLNEEGKALTVTNITAMTGVGISIENRLWRRLRGC